MKIHDVAIVGAGPAGSALAVYLRRMGLDVLLLDKEDFPRDKVCGDFISPKGLRFLQDLDCLEELQRQPFFPIRKSAVYLNGEKLSEGYLPRISGLPEHGYAIPRKILDEVLFRKAQQLGAETIENARFIDFSITGKKVKFEIKSAKSKLHTFYSRMIVGADGAQSAVAKSAGLAMQDPRYVLASIRTYCKNLSLNKTVLLFEEEFFPGFGWCFPVDEQLANVGVGMVSDSIKKNRISLKQFYGKLLTFLNKISEEKNLELEIGDPVGWPIKTYGGARENYFDRGLLVGEAGCFVDPISGEGIPLAFETAALASEVIWQAFAKWDFSKDSLADYETRWRQRYDPDLKISDLIVSVIRNKHLVELWLKSFEIMSKTANSDRAYALKVGGILAGIVPNREGFSPEVILKSLFHSPEFWMEIFKISPHNFIEDMIKSGVNFTIWEMTTLNRILGDINWFRDWWIEVNEKQINILNGLIDPK